jgi:TonB family protein
MSIRTLGFLLVCFTATRFGQAEQALCPRHIEAPVYPSIAQWANVTGKVSLALTIDADGKVADVKVTTTESNVPGSHLLESMTVTNIRRWTFAKPSLAPYKQTVVYDYEIDGSLPLDGPTKVTFDLPERVTIVASGRSLQPSGSTEKN